LQLYAPRCPFRISWHKDIPRDSLFLSGNARGIS
jgi:hypothetical protein